MNDLHERREELVARYGEPAYNEMLLAKARKRDKPGRPVEGERKLARAMTVTDSDMDLLREIGDGNASAGLRKLLEQYRGSLSADGNA